jgi:type II secretory pathway pseudopilin PulG
MYLQGQGRIIDYRRQRGFAMAALLVGLSVMMVMLVVAMPVWKTAVTREKEAELIWRGQQYARAVQLFQRKYANAFPPNLDILINERFLRKKYKDPMTKDGEFQLIPAAGPGAPGAPGAVGTVPQQGQPGRPATGLDGGRRGPAGAQGGILGVVSKSTDTSVRLYNGRSKYNEWAFTAQQASQRIGAPDGSGRPGMPPGRQGQPRPGVGGPAGGSRPGMPQPQRPFGLPSPRPPGI